jgi:hypothetical protein
MERLTDAAGGGIDGGGVADETRTGPAVVPHGQGRVEMAAFDNGLFNSREPRDEHGSAPLLWQRPVTLSVWVRRMDEKPRRPLRLRQNWNTALSWIIRGDASPPRNEPKTLVGVLAVLTIEPKVGDETSKSGF